MKKCTWKKYTASVLVAAMLAAQPMAVYADEASTASQAAYSDTEAKDINGVYERVSDKVAGMLANGELTYSETSGYLYNASGSKVDPETGAEIPDTTETETETETKAPETETKAPETETKAPETETKASETSASETETESQTGTGESETESQTGATDTETGTTETGTTETGSETESESQSETASSETTTPGSSSDNASASTDSKATESQTTAETGSNTQQDVSYKASGVFKKIGDRVQYNVDVPIKGLPSFITQEMIVGALKSQDEYGYPASVTIAQIIQESGYGTYGPGGNKGQGLSGLAYGYCNLFGIKGSGTAGSVSMRTSEMTKDGKIYSTTSAFRAYNTYSEAIEDRCKVLQNGYGDLISGVNDANTFAMRIGQRWATDLNYGKSLIKLMELYDLYRLDDMTLKDFSAMIGRFADPCPGAVVTSNFGFREFDNKFHKGLDLGTGSENIPTYAAESGTVIFAGYSGSAGNLITIDHGNGLVTKYMHHSEIYVKVGDHVEKGQQIGLSGTTGRSTGNHLHFQVEENGVAVNPLLYLEGNGTSSELQRMDPMKDIVSGTKVVLEKKDIETSGEDAQNAAVEETEAAESIAETDSQKQQKETAVETAEIADSAKQVVDKAVKTEKKTIK
ncbi:peptidoglycan DD-metalloendopeptidase family protein [Coprococcus sp. B2-R-112]|uniref:peptidoglycan DD-metalloendopeptidase family protein n=1 Tax=Coprococcus sp. B2-R-112 TaxID=2949662 RepID=UPI002F3E22CD